MTRGEALALKTFTERCNCGGFAYQMNGRNPRAPHMSWCPQMPEYAEWVAALDDVVDPHKAWMETNP
jgi:hypothetical protein